MIAIWWAQVDSGKSARMVDCEKYVFHPHCRGTQAKKRIIPTVVNDGKADKVCMCKSAGLGSNYGGRGRNIIVNSKLLESMLSHGFDVDTIYDAYLTYLSSSSSSVNNKNDELSRRNSISRSSSNNRGSSNSVSNSNHHHGEQSGNEERRDEKEKRKRDKKERKDVKKRDRGSMSADELLRLDEVRRSLKIRGRRKEKEKLPSGITADYSASFFAQLDRDLVENTSCKSGPSTSWNRTPDGLTQSDSSEASLTSLTNVSGRSLPPLPPKPPKRGILKGSRINISNIATVAECTGSDVVQNGNEVEPNHCEASNLLVRNTLQNEVIAYQNMQNPNNQERKDDICSEEESLFQSHHYAADSLTDTTNSSFATPPFSLSPIGESQGFSRWRSSSSFEEQGVNLSLPEIIPLVLPEPRELTIQRQPPPRNDFGFSLRRGTIIDRCINGSTPSMKAVIFAEPGAMIQNNNDTGLLPGDRLIGVNGLNVEDMSREEIIDLIKKCPDYVSVKVQPVAELSELSRRGGSDGRQVELAPANIRSGTLRRSGSLRFHQNTWNRAQMVMVGIHLVDPIHRSPVTRRSSSLLDQP
ncbi:hypothetical protein PV326_013862 [Microctonus aethiopoides]|nr:hypothetical protein PV326_013862 [Microctonus aethiopoides]